MDNINIELLPNSIFDRKKHQIYINPSNYMKPTMLIFLLICLVQFY